MQNLFKENPLPAGYQTFSADLIVLPISLTRYYYLFWDQDGPQLHQAYMKEKHANNKIVEAGEWFSPPEQ